MQLRRSSSAANITSMPETAHEERVARMRNYAIAMGIRTACFLALIWVRGPWMLVFAAGAILLPYFAVVLANHVRRRAPEEVARPQAVQIISGGPAGSAGSTDAAGDGARAHHDREAA